MTVKKAQIEEDLLAAEAEAVIEVVAEMAATDLDEWVVTLIDILKDLDMIEKMITIECEVQEIIGMMKEEIRATIDPGHLLEEGTAWVAHAEADQEQGHQEDMTKIEDPQEITKADRMMETVDSAEETDQMTATIRPHP